MPELQKKTCVIMPAHNEAESIVSVIDEVHRWAPMVDIVVINDASMDDTRAQAERRNVLVLDLPINLGIGGAMQTGFKFAYRNGYDMAMQLDADGQHDPRFILDLLKVLESGRVDMVIGSRFLERIGYTSSFLRLFGIRFFAWLIGVMTNQRIFDATSGFRAYNRSALEFAAINYPADFPEPESIVQFLRNGFRIKEVPVVMKARQGGVSSVRLGKGIYFVASNALAIIMTTFKRRIR